MTQDQSIPGPHGEKPLTEARFGDPYESAICRSLPAAPACCPAAQHTINTLSIFPARHRCADQHGLTAPPAGGNRLSSPGCGVLEGISFTRLNKPVLMA